MSVSEIKLGRCQYLLWMRIERQAHVGAIGAEGRVETVREVLGRHSVCRLRNAIGIAICVEIVAVKLLLLLVARMGRLGGGPQAG